MDGLLGLFIIAGIIYLPACFLTGFVARTKNRSFLAWMAVAFFFTPLFGLIAAAAVAPKVREDPSTNTLRGSLIAAWLVVIIGVLVFYYASRRSEPRVVQDRPVGSLFQASTPESPGTDARDLRRPGLPHREARACDGNEFVGDTRSDAPVPLGQIADSAQGVDPVTLNMSDFPYASYIQAIHRKIQERWNGRAIDGRQPEVIFDIGADGQLRRLQVGKTSGNVDYDQAALRALCEASPFPPLPDGFGKSSLTVSLQFIYEPRAR